jgi:hypothetical protein
MGPRELLDRIAGYLRHRRDEALIRRRLRRYVGAATTART